MGLRLKDRLAAAEESLNDILALPDIEQIPGENPSVLVANALSGLRHRMDDLREERDAAIRTGKQFEQDTRISCSHVDQAQGGSSVDEIDYRAECIKLQNEVDRLRHLLKLAIAQEQAIGLIEKRLRDE